LEARIAAVRVLQRVLLEGRSLSEALELGLRAVRPGPDVGLAREIIFGVLRWYGRLEAVADLLLTRPLKAKDQDVRLLVLVGLYQILEMRVPAHAAVATTVEGTRGLKKAWAAGMVNAVLRRFLREREALLAQVDADPQARLAHPAWMISHYQQAWPEDWERFLLANNARPPMTLRVNQRRIGVEDYLQQLQAAELMATPSPLAPQALVLAAPVPVERLPGFAEGLVSVQDLAAQQAAVLLDAGAGMRVLDACAAPGGKSCHILERHPDLAELVALDIEPQRLERIHQNLDRLGLQATVLQGDGALPQQWWNGVPFDRILLDAPCSGSGVIRRHPDIKWLRRQSDIPALAAAQRRLLGGLWPLLKPGGKLLYATCSVFPEENARVLAEFMAERADARAEPLPVDWGRAQAVGRQVPAGDNDMDGFYYGCLSKT
jgi:16S rRNA (cytosine967-C5)-methyltransferase